METVTVKIMPTGTRPFVVAVVCNPPNAHSIFFDNIDRLLSNLSAGNNEVVVIGDINIDLGPESANASKKRLLDTVDSY